MKKTLTIIGSLIVILVVIGGGIWYRQKNKAVNNQPVASSQPVVINQ